MARGRKRGGGSSTGAGETEDAKAAPPAPAFRPFADALKGVAAPPARDEPRKKDTKSAAPPPPPSKRGDDEEDDAELFRKSLAGVTPLSKRQRERVPKAKPPAATVPSFDEDAEALARLAALVDGAEPMTWEHTDEHSEWIADDVEPTILKRLVDGEFAWQAHLDLHGLTRDPARDALVRFLHSSRAQGHRCVLVVHGRGHHSEGATPVLKPLVQRWLRRAPMKDWVFAFATARPVDGGAGAMYVMLRK